LVQADGAPDDVDPYEYLKARNLLPLDPSQTVPRLSQETHKDFPRYLIVAEGMELAFGWISEEVSPKVITDCHGSNSIQSWLAFSDLMPRI